MNTEPPRLFEQLVAAGTSAPSSHNTQPWRFREVSHGIEIHADRSRALPVNDPHDRELTISCGAALCNLRLVAAHAQCSTLVELLPDPADRDLLARVTLTGRSEPPAEDDQPYSMLGRRHTWRKPFLDRRVSTGETLRLAAAAAHHGAELRWIDSSGRERLATLVEQAGRQQSSNQRWRRELASWMRSGSHGDGLPVATAGLPFTRWSSPSSTWGTAPVVATPRSSSRRHSWLSSARTPTSPGLAGCRTSPPTGTPHRRLSRDLRRLRQPAMPGRLVGPQRARDRLRLVRLPAAGPPWRLPELIPRPGATTATPRCPVPHRDASDDGYQAQRWLTPHEAQARQEACPRQSFHRVPRSPGRVQGVGDP